MKRFKANIILGKKQIILASLVLVLGASVYVNWLFAGQGTGLDNTDNLNASGDPTNQIQITNTPETTQTQSSATETKTDEKPKNLGDTLLVNSKTISNEDYFTMAKLTRTKTRDKAIDTIQTVLNDEKLTEEDKKDVSAKVLSITDIIETESRVENLIKSKGFSDCIVYITGTNASVVVKSDGLDQTKATQIKNIVVTETKLKGENISITEIK